MQKRKIAASLGLVLAASAVGTSSAAGVGSSPSTAADVSAVSIKASPIQTTWKYQQQKKSYWCGPAATRIALSVWGGKTPSQKSLAKDLHTEEDGETKRIEQVRKRLNERDPKNRYRSTNIPNDNATKAQKKKFWSNTTRSIDKGFPVVANIVAPASNHPPGYPNKTIWHYVTIVGYDAAGKNTVRVADPAAFAKKDKRGTYTISADKMARMIALKGYAHAR